MNYKLLLPLFVLSLIPVAFAQVEHDMWKYDKTECLPGSYCILSNDGESVAVVYAVGYTGPIIEVENPSGRGGDNSDEKVKSSSDEKPKKGSNNDHKTKPTFGLSHFDFNAIVSCGFSWDGTCYDVTDNWHTENEKISILTHNSYDATIKVYAARPLLSMELSLVPEIGALHKAEYRIQIILDGMYEPTIKEIKLVQKYKVISNGITGEINTVNCGYSTLLCYELKLYDIKFRAIPTVETIAIQAIDVSRRSQTTFFNEGLQVWGLSAPLEIND